VADGPIAATRDAQTYFNRTRSPVEARQSDTSPRFRVQTEAAAASLRRAAELAPPDDHRAAEALAKLGPAGRR